MTSVCQNHHLVNPAIPSLSNSESLRLSGSFPPITAPGIAYEWKGVFSGLPVHLSVDFGVICEFAHPPLAISPPPRRPHWNRLQAGLGKYGRAEG